MKKTDKKKSYKKFFLRSIPLYILIIFAFIVSICSFGLYSEYNRNDRAMDTNHPVDAYVTSIRPLSNGTTPGYSKDNWYVYYEYYDGEFLYKGSVVARKETAEASLNGTLPIYIDGHGHCETVSEYNWRKESGATKRALTIGIAFLVCFGIFAGVAVLLFLMQRKKLKE